MQAKRITRLHRNLRLLLVCLTAGVLLIPAPALAVLPYSTFSTDYDGKWIPSPDAYKPDRVIEGFDDPADLFITSDDHIYVADRGNNRIVHLDAQGRVIRYIPSEDGSSPNGNAQEEVRGPEGVFVSEKTGEMYVADTGKRRVVVYTADGRFDRQYVSPPSQYIPENYLYVPSKVVVDHRGYLYVANKGGYQGLLQMTADGEFAGFFGANKVEADWLDRLKRRFFTEEQLAEEEKKLPGAIHNMMIDERGFIYTINRNLRSGQLKRLNAAGYDLFNDVNFAPWNGPLEMTNFTDLTVSREGILTSIEEGTGYINQYDGDGNLIFTFGAGSSTERRYGLMRRPTSVVTNSRGDLIVADGDLNLLHWFVRTEFGELVHLAIGHTAEGDYQQAREYWTQVLRYHGAFGRAYQGIAKAEFAEQTYESALLHYEMARDKEGYSEVFWELRMKWLQRYFGPVMTGLVLLWAAGSVARRWRRRKGKGKAAKGNRRLSRLGNDWVLSLRYVRTLLTRPIDTMYEIANAPHAKFWFAAALAAVGFAVHLYGKSIVSFLFADVEYKDLNLYVEAAQYLLLWFLWVLANYLTGSVMYGEGTFQKVFIVNAYALVPLILFTLPLQALSNVLTLQEKVFYDTAFQIVYGWTLALMFIGTMTVHNYNMKESIRMSAVSIFSLCCIALFGFALAGLIFGAVDFFMQLGEELVSRG